MSNKTLGERLKKAAAWPSKFLFGDDIFISYSRADGATYAAGLANELAGRNFSCRFDLWGTEPGKEMPNSLKRALRRSALLVLVGSRSAAKSTHVAQEVAELKRRGRKIVPVAFDGVVLRNGVAVQEGNLTRVEGLTNSAISDEALWAADIEGLPVSCERGETLKTGDPSPEIISRIEKTFTFSRKDERLRKATAAVAALLMVLLGASVVAGYVATRKGREATIKTAEAALAEGRAREANLKAQQQEENARQQTIRATEAAAKATVAEKLASEKTKLAEEKTKLAADKTKLAAEKTQLAAEKTKLADAATKRADEQTVKADEASKRAAAQELSAHKNLARSFYGQAQAEAASNPLRALAWADKAVQEAPAGDEDRSSYVLRAVNLASKAPVSVVNSPVGLAAAGFSHSGQTVVTVTETGKFAVWDGRTGEPLPHPYADAKTDYVLDMVYFHQPVFSPDGERIAMSVWETSEAGNRELHLRVWKARTGSTVQDIRLEGWGGTNEKLPKQIIFGPDGEEIIVFTLGNTGMLVWNIASGKLREYERPIGTSDWIGLRDDLPVSRNPTRNWFMSGASNKRVPLTVGGEILTDALQLRDIKTGQVLDELPLVNHESPKAERIYFADFTPDAQKVIVMSNNGSQTLLRLWDVVAKRVGKPKILDERWGDTGGYFIAGTQGVSYDGKRLVITRNGNIVILDITGEELKGPLTDVHMQVSKSGRRPIEQAFFTDDSEYVVGVSSASDGEQEVTVWSSHSGRLASEAFIVRGAAQLSEISTRNKTVSVTYKDGTVLTWDLMRNASVSAVTPAVPQGDITFERAALTPDRRSLLTIGYDNNNPRGRAALAMQLWDAGTGAKKWLTEIPYAYTTQEIKFSPDGTRFIVLPIPNRPTLPDDIAPRTRRTIDGAPEPNFRPLTSARIERVEFSRDGTTLITENLNPPSGVLIKRWSATTGAPVLDPIRELPYKEAQFLGFTRFGEYCMVLPRGEAAYQNYTEMDLLKVDADLSLLVKLRFADHATAVLAVALFREAKDLRQAGNDGLVATLDSGVTISVVASPTGALLTNEQTKRQLLAPLDSGAEFSGTTLSPDGRLVAVGFGFKESSLVRVWDSATGLPLSERLWHEGEIKNFTFSSDSTKLLTTSKFGVLRSWFFPEFENSTPVWMAKIGEALSGLRVVRGMDIQRVSQDEYVKSRREFENALRDAAAAGDEGARFLLAPRKP